MSAAPGRHALRHPAVVLGLLALLVYNVNFRTIGAGDTVPARYLPLCLWGGGTLYLDPYLEEARMGSPSAYWILRTPDDRFASQYPIVAPLLATPLYAPAALFLTAQGWTRPAVERAAELTEKLAASTLAAASVGLVYLLLRRRSSRRTASLLSVAYAFGSTTYMTSSQGLWQHGPAQLLLTVALLSATSRSLTPVAVALSGVASGLLTANRPPDALLAAGVGLFVLLRAWRRPGLLLLFPLAALLAGAPFLVYNLASFGLAGGGYSVMLATLPPDRGFFSHPLADGLQGLLLSPGKGLLAFSPFFAFLLVRPFRREPSGTWSLLDRCLVPSAAAYVYLLARTDWTGGVCYGPRFLTDLLPVLVLWLAPVVDSFSSVSRLIFVGLTAFAVAVQVVGAFYYKGASDAHGDPRRDVAAVAEIRTGKMPLTFLTWLRDRGEPAASR